MISFEPVSSSDMRELTAISVRAFHSDVLVGAPSVGGPPGYNSVAFHQKMMRISTAFFKIMSEGQCVGAFWIKRQRGSSAELWRIFIDPDFQGNGIGKKAFAFLFARYPEITHWQLDTPAWNTRTNAFYTALGFKVLKVSDGMVFFERKMVESSPG